ncbi:hypothetical protein C8R44DRAFT_886077 [Mycena epipterygia]|nr:hypothetical protein C8R44DRAFT_886077 [Mycena epipterygia]
MTFSLGTPESKRGAVRTRRDLACPLSRLTDYRARCPVLPKPFLYLLFLLHFVPRASELAAPGPSSYIYSASASTDSTSSSSFNLSGVAGLREEVVVYPASSASFWFAFFFDLDRQSV